ncbi:TasA family protein [Chloroflexota bacterium]
MKKILASIMIIALVCALIGTGVYAAFSDTETSSGNQFYSGTLDLQVEGEDDPNVTPALIGLNLTGMKPGEEQTATIALNNAGTLEGNAKIKFASVVGSNEDATKPEPEQSDEDSAGSYVIEEIAALDVDNPQLYIKVDVTWGGVAVNLGTESLTDGNTYFDLAELEDITTTLGDLGPTAGSPKDLVIKLTLDPDDETGNVFQGDKAAFDLVFYLDQV